MSKNRLIFVPSKNCRRKLKFKRSQGYPEYPWYLNMVNNMKYNVVSILAIIMFNFDFIYLVSEANNCASHLRREGTNEIDSFINKKWISEAYLGGDVGT